MGALPASEKHSKTSPSPFRSAPHSVIGCIFFVKSIFHVFIRSLAVSRQFSHKLHIDIPTSKKTRSQSDNFENSYETSLDAQQRQKSKKLRKSNNSFKEGSFRQLIKDSDLIIKILKILM